VGVEPLALRLPDRLAGVVGPAPLEVGGGHDLGAVLGEPDVGEVGGPAVEDDGLEPERLLRPRERPAEGAVEEAVRHRADEPHDTPGGALERREVHRPDGEDDDVLRVERARLGRDVLVDELRGEAVPPEEPPGVGLVDRLGVRIARLQVDVQYLAAVHRGETHVVAHPVVRGFATGLFGRWTEVARRPSVVCIATERSRNEDKKVGGDGVDLGGALADRDFGIGWD